MSIKLPSSLMVSGVVVSASQVAVSGFKVRAKLLAPDGAALTTINNDLGQPLEATTAADGGFSLNIKDGSTIKQLLTLGYALLFKSAEDDLPSSQAEGLSRSTPLHLDAQKSVTVTLCYQAKQAADATKPAVSARLFVQSVSRDGILQSPSWLISGVVEGPQGLGVGGLVLSASLVVPSTGQLVEFPQPVDRPILTTSNQDGSFRLEIVRGGDLLPFLPYSVYGLRISARAGQSAERSSSTPVAVDLCHTRPDETTVIKLRWDATDPSNPSLRIACVHRDGKGCKPAEGTLLALGQLVDSGTSLPLANHRIQVQASSSLRAMGEAKTDARGFFSLAHPWPLSLAPSDVSMNWKLQVFDPNGIKVATDVVLSQDGKTDAALPVQITLPMVTDSSPTIKQLLDALKKKLDPKTQGALDAAKLKTLQAVLQNGGVSNIKGAERVDADSLLQVDRAADLWSMLPTSIAADSAVKSIATWLGKNIGGTEYLGNLPRAEGTAALQTELGDFAAGQTHSVAVARNNLLNFLLLGARMDAKKAGALGVKKLRADTLLPLQSLTAALPESTTQGCSCSECQTAVSPNAYLMDLIRYTYFRVITGNSPLSIDDLQSSFFQPFAELPTDCAAMNQPVLTIRIAIEILRAYGATQTLTSSQTTTLASGVSEYVQRAYDALLSELGTSQTELRLAVGNADQMSALAERLGIPSATEVQQLLLGAPDEATLESRFGLRASTRGPLDTVSVPDFLTWRLQRLRSGWKRQDAPVRFPTDVPILDPDVIDASNLRRGWDSTHVTTTRWNTRRAGIDTQLSNFHKSRALALGAAVMTITQPTVMSPSDDQKWAAYLTVSLSDDAVQSMAATLPIAQQDQAKPLAAKQRVETAKVARGGTLPLSSDEQTSVTAVVSYTGTSLTASVQTAAQDWVDGRFTGLIPTSGTAISAIDDWATIHGVIKGSATGSLTTATQNLARFGFPTDAFLRAFDLRLKLKNQGFRAFTDDDSAELAAIFVMLWKSAQFATWITEEQTDSIVVSSSMFWVSGTQPAQVKWLGSPERYQKWLAAMDAALSDPIINPALLSTAAFLSTDSADPAYPAFDLWQQRTTWLGTLLTSLTTARTNVDSAAAANKLSTFDDQVLSAMLLIPKVSSAANRWYEPAQLQLAYDQGSMTGAHLAQLLLDRSGFQGLFALRSLIRDGKATTDQEWIPAMLTLLKAAIGLKYGEWRMEEATQNISQSPLFFQLPPAQPLTFPPQSSASDAPNLLVFTRVDLQKWRKVVADRIDQESLVKQEHAALLDRVEQSTLALLRGVLLGAYNNGLTVPSIAEALSDRFLFDFSDSPSNKVSRVAQAIATIQRLLQGLRSGDLFRYKTSATAAAYPNVRLEAEHFDSEWQWLGSYGSWRSALFIFMYPENLLYPTLRAKTEQSEVFQSIVRESQAGGPITPADADAYARQYQDYFLDMNSLFIRATCFARIPYVASDVAPVFQTEPLTRDICLSFALGLGTGTLGYWNYREISESPTAFQSMWNRIPIWDQIQSIEAAVPYRSKKGQHYVVVFAIVYDNSSIGTKLQILKLDLNRLDDGALAWDASPTDLDLPERLPGWGLVSIAVEQVAGEGAEERVPHVYLAKWRVETQGSSLSYATDVYRRALNDTLSSWSRESLCDTIPGRASLRFGFTTNNSSSLNQNIGYNFVIADGPTEWLINEHYQAANIDSSAGAAGLNWLVGNVSGVRVSVTNNGTEIRRVILFGSNGTHILLLEHPDGYLGLAAYSQPSPILTYAKFASELYDSENSAIVTMYTTGGQSLPDTLFRMKLNLWPSSAGIEIDGQIQTTLHAAFEVPYKIPSALPSFQDSSARKEQNYTYLNNNISTTALLAQEYEAFFAVPMYLGLQLQQAKHFADALAWFRSVYDYTLHEQTPDPNSGDLRKIYWFLVKEETALAEGYVRTQQWIADPYNPHAVAGLRQNAYTRFTLLSIIRCLIEYADSEFASDTPESVPRARELYLDALQLLDQPELAVPLDCADMVATMDFSFVPSDWQGATTQLQAALTSTMALLSPSTASQLQTSVTTLLKDTTKPKWADRFAAAWKALKSARASAPKPAKFGAAFKNDRSVRSQAQLALLSVPELARMDLAVQQKVRQGFHAGLAKLTGVSAGTLQSDSTVKMDWMSRPSRTRNATMNPAKRSPILAQPSSAISASYKRALRWDPLQPTTQGISGQQLAAAPAMALAALDPQTVQFVPTASVSFCIPPNPVIAGLRLRAQLNLYKLRSGRNITGVQRQLDFFAAPTDAQSGLPAIGANGGLSLPGSSRIVPTEYRYPVLLERARRQIQVAAQFESQLLQSLEQADNQRENLLRARNELATQQAALNVKKLEIQEAQLGVDLVTKQQERNSQVVDYLQGLINEDVSVLELASLNDLDASITLQGVAIAFNIASSVTMLAANANVFQTGTAFGLSLQALAQASSGLAGIAATQAQIARTRADFERRKKEWQQQQRLANKDAEILGVQLQQADLHVKIRQQDANLTNLAIDHAQSVVDFLVTKFTNAELFEWMSRILQGLYAEQLQRATATARLAQQQLAFDLLQAVDVIQTNYWNIPVQNVLPGSTPSSSAGPDRKGLTGAERLLADLEQLDSIAAQQTTRKLQLTRTLSLATVAPGDFQRLKETGEMWFQTTEKDFDQEFPGHYFRRIHKVRVSVLALTPAARGIRATLTNVGPSRVTVPGTAGFVQQTLPASNESVSLSSPQNASGLFDLDIQSELKLPFEGVGVDSLWHFELPMPANPMDFDSIADVQVTFEYTAKYSADYRAELIADPVKLPRTFSGVRVFSFRSELVDQWYALHNPPPAPAAPALTDVHATFAVDAADFPSGMNNVRVKRLTLYVPLATDANGNKIDLSKDAKSRTIGLGFGASGTPAFQSLDPDSLAVAQSAADAWFRQLPAKTQSPFGTWTLVLPGTQTMLDLLRKDQVKDILLAMTYEADLPDWPTGLRPKRALF